MNVVTDGRKLYNVLPYRMPDGFDEEMKSKNLRMAEYYGMETQLDKLFEEANELIEALKAYRKVRELKRTFSDETYAETREKALFTVFEEAADVSILTEQVTSIEGHGDLFKHLRKFKVDRQILRIAMNEPKWCGNHDDKGAGREGKDV